MINKIFISIMILSLTLLPVFPAFAGDKFPKGYTLDVDSYVFTIDEATRLMDRIKYLEKVEKELVEQKKLVLLQDKQLTLYKLNSKNRQDQLKYYSDLASINHKLLKKYEEKSNLNGWTNVGYMVLGIALTTGAFILAGSIIENTSSN